MSRLSEAKKFLSRYESRHSGYKAAGEALKRYISETLDAKNIPYHSIAARAKSIDSLRGKLTCRVSSDQSLLENGPFGVS